MKKIVIYVLIGLLVGAGLMYLLRPVRFPSEIKPATPTSFGAVTARLDAGGDLYAYISTERLIRSIESLVGKFAKTMPNQTGQNEAAVGAFVFRLLGKLGLNEISGVGLSNVAVTPQLQRTRVVVHHYADKNKGLIWQLGNAEARELVELDLLPADTALAAFNEFRVDNFWTWTKKEVETSGIPSAQSFIRQVEPLLALQGIQLPKLLGSLTGSFGYVVTLDKQRKIILPGAERALSVPEPGLAIVLGVKDATLFELLKSKLPMASFSEKAGRKTLQFPVMPVPFPLEPCFTAIKDYLIISSSPRLADAILQSRDKKNGLRQSDEYKELARYVPTRGNGFSFVSPRLWRIYVDVMEKAAAKSDNKQMMDVLFSIFPRELKAFSVVEHCSDGVVWTACHNMSPELIVLLPVASMAGIASAVAIPNFLSAAQKGKQKNTLADMKSIGTAIESYMTDYGKSPLAESTADLQKLLVPLYIKTLPLKDAWGNDLLYKKSGKSEYMIASPGKDGIFQGWQQQGTYPAAQFDPDIIFANGQFVYGPEQ